MVLQQRRLILASFVGGERQDLLDGILIEIFEFLLRQRAMKNFDVVDIEFRAAAIGAGGELEGNLGNGRFAQAVLLDLVLRELAVDVDLESFSLVFSVVGHGDVLPFFGRELVLGNDL